MIPSNTKIAVVEDDASFARSLERLLRASGFEFCWYSSAEAYLQPATRPAPDCLLLDIHLGGMSGLVLQQQMRAAGCTTPIIFLTANETPGSREQAERAGCSAYFLKPVPGETLLKAIAQAVGTHTTAA
jgi:FixJ family two-component response regulator